MTEGKLQAEFDRQLNNLLTKNYPELAGINHTDFSDMVKPLQQKLTNNQYKELDIEKGHLPFVIVVPTQVIPSKEQFKKIVYSEKPAILGDFPIEFEKFVPINEADVSEQIYLLVNIDRGEEYLNVPPKEALLHVLANGQTPLTIDEGIAIMTQFPEFLIKNKCFSLLASRSGDKRVPAFWISENQAKLGWCWDGNPHTWLGSAFAEKRIK